MSTFGPRYLAVVPAYNESHTVADVVRSIRGCAPQFDILVVDDGSTDDTGPRAEAAGAKVLRHPFNLGIGGAVQTGFAYAVENDYDFLAQVDGDGQHDAAELGRLIQAMDADRSVDVVCGSRFLTDDSI